MHSLKKMVPKSVKRKLRAIRDGASPAVANSSTYTIRTASGDALSGQVAVVTGGSGSIGRSIACHLAAEGAIVYVGGMTQSKIDAVVAEITEMERTAYPTHLDVSDEAEIVRVFSEIAERHGRLDIMVHSAGGSARSEYAALVDQTTEVIDSVLSTNLRGAILCSREAARLMVKNGYGRIINISSILGIQGKANFAEYAASKGGVLAFTKSIAMELGQQGITANCVSPGIVERNVVTSSRMKKIARTNWLNSSGKPEDIAAMVAYLATEQASFITGQNLIVDGGRSVGLKGD